MNETGIVSKYWWQSRGVWGGIVAAFAGGASLFGYAVDQGEMLNLAMSGVAIAGAVLAIVGRVKAEKPIKKKSKEVM